MKKLIALMLALSMSIGTATIALAEGDSDNEKTLGEIEEEMMDYVNDTYPDIEYGSLDYIEFIQEQLFGDTDEELKEKENYDELILYANEYIYELNKAGAKVTGNEIFAMPDETRNMTVGEIKRLSELEDEKDLEYQRKRSGMDAKNSGYDVFIIAQILFFIWKA